MNDDINAQLESLYSTIEAATSEGLTEEAIRHCESALRLIDLHADDELALAHSDFLMLAGNALWEAGDLEGAQRHYRQALEMEPGRLDAAVAVGVSLFHLARFEAARVQLEVVSAEDTEIAEVWYYLALLALRRGDTTLSDVFFHRANEMEPERWLVPRFLARKEMTELVAKLVDDLPEEIRHALENVPIILETRPSDSLLHTSEPPLDPLLLGLFEGTPVTEVSVFDPQLAPTRIMLFGENISLLASDNEKLEEELWITLKHEIGHYFGLDEDELASRGLE